MLLGTGLGSRAAAGARVGGGPSPVLLWPVAAVAALVALFPWLGALSAAPSLRWTAAGAGALSLGMGAALGVALPTGIRLLAGSERRVAEAWAINGAFSVAGASIGALAGLIWGSLGLAALALPCYVAVLVIGWLEPRRGALLAKGRTIAPPCTTYEIHRDDRLLSPPSATTQTEQSKQE
jgi:hypothetical protein